MFIDVFRELCAKKGVTCNKACVDIGISRTSVAKWKQGATPSGPTIAKFAEYFGVSADYLLGDRNAPASPEELERQLVEATRERLLEVMDQDGYIAEDCLRDLGFRKSDFKAWRSGESDSFMPRLAEIADMLDVSAAYLLGKSFIRIPPALADGGNNSEEIQHLLDMFQELNPVKRRKIMRSLRDEVREQRRQSRFK